ncbi:glycerate kinase [Tissierella sp. Yu-01]|uniref:glycerate kinase n=1 Tax=Tissierella sp. Yu-01 TaxID=3035694 RepID=UPI00240D099C|nr:glycerate kinase [Tissierella sp. Yu-01]WFA08073.1 glycerate kinase [Tissierella sp. Yu-01]
MKIIIASDSYKGSCSSIEVANAIEKGIREVYDDAEIIKIPVADGGEGTVDALVNSTGGRYEEIQVLNPLGHQITAKYGVIHDEFAVIEMASASGITLINQNELNPLITTTYGTGELIKDAMEKGLRKILVGLGGSSTNDGGVGMAQALGFSFKDKSGKEISFGGGELAEIKEIDSANVHPLLKDTEIIAMSDVDNPLYGPTGAAYIFGPQKGADKYMVTKLDENLQHYAKLLKNFSNKDISNIPGSGAAGGLGAGLIAFCNASIEPGISKILDITGIDSYLIDADLVITGEGRIDGQSVFGKVPVGIAKRSGKYNVPVIAIVGSIGEGVAEVYSHGIDAIIDIINKPMTLEYAMANAEELITKSASNAMRMYKMQDRTFINL